MTVLYLLQSYALEVIEGGVVEVRGAGCIERIPWRNENNHPLSCSCKQNAICVSEIVLIVGVDYSAPTTSSEIMEMPL